MKNYFNYFTETEEHFARKRGKNLLVSPLDWCLIELWKNNGIPLHIVLRGIDRSFETAQKRQKRPPGSLYYCHQAILDAFQEYQQATLGSPETSGSEDAESGSTQSGPSKEQVLGYLERLRQCLPDVPGNDGLRLGRTRLYALEGEIRISHGLDYQRIEEELAQIGSQVAEELGRILEPERMALLTQESEEETRVYKKRLAAEMYRRFRQAQLEKRVRKEFGVSEFSLFPLADDETGTAT